jgi:hypothetical protein
MNSTECEKGWRLEGKEGERREGKEEGERLEARGKYGKIFISRAWLHFRAFAYVQA